MTFPKIARFAPFCVCCLVQILLFNNLFLTIGSVRNVIAVQSDKADLDLLTLEGGKTVTREVSGAKPDIFGLKLDSQHYVRLAVEGLGVDIGVSLFSPDRKLIVRVDNPTQRQAVSFISLSAGTYRVEVSAVKNDAQPGRYTVKLEELHSATKDDESRVLAYQICLQGDQLRAQTSAQSVLKSIERYQESRLIYTRVNDQRGMAATSISIAKAYVDLKEAQKAFANFEQAASLYATLKDERNEAYSLYLIGVLLDQSNEKLKAIEVLNRSLMLWRGIDDKRRTAITLYYLGTVHNDLNDRKKALECLNEALALHRASNNQDGEATTLRYLADLFLTLGDIEKALTHYKQARTVRRNLKDPPGEADTLNDLAILYMAIGRTQDALDSSQEALTIAKALHDPKRQAFNEFVLGGIYASIGVYNEAASHLEKALVFMKQIHDEEKTAAVLSSLVWVYNVLGESEKALQSYTEAQPILKLANLSAEMTTTLMAGALYLREAQYDKALESFERTRLLAHQTGDRQFELWPTTLSGVAFYYLNNKEKAIEILSGVLPKLQALGDRTFQLIALAFLAIIERDQGDLMSAKNRVEAALKLLETTRTSVISPELRLSFFSSVQDFFDNYIDLLMRLHKQQPERRFNLTALEASEQSRARSLLELLNEARIDIHQDVNSALVQREAAAREKVNAAEFQRALVGGIYTAAQARTSASEIEAATIEYQNIQAKIRQESPSYAALTQPQPLAVSSIQELLDPNTILLEYKLGQDRSYVWLVSQTEVSTYELPAGDEITKLARAFYESLSGGTVLDAEAVQQGQRLSQILLGPIASRLGQKRLVIVADGALQYLPFTVLTEPSSSGTDSRSKKPLIVNHEIITLPSMSVLAALRRELAGREPPSKETVIIADPVFDKSDQRVKRTASENGAESVFNERHWNRLEGTQLEADQITRLAGAGKTTRALDFAANRELVISGALSQYRHIFFATHTELNDTKPELSAIVLSLVDENGNSRNRYLRLNDVYNLKLSAELVILSGCETGLGQEVKGEGLIGLTRGFMYAGAAGVIASLWRVDDTATSQLIARFYRAMIKKGKRPADALRAAQLEMLSSKDWNAPHYWAPFVLQGEWR